MNCGSHRHGGAGAMDPRRLICQGRCSSAREDKPNSQPQQHSGVTISQAAGEFNSQLEPRNGDRARERAPKIVEAPSAGGG